MKLFEFSPNTFDGSWHQGLVFNKLWLIHELKKISRSYGVIYILGSWYSNMAILLDKSGIDYDKIINVDTDRAANIRGSKIAKKLGVENLEVMTKDANTLDYRQLDSDGLVINTSCHDMPNRGWFDNIPSGTVVALQSRTDVDHDLDQYKLSKVLYDGEKTLRDPETTYTSTLVIGVK